MIIDQINNSPFTTKEFLELVIQLETLSEGESHEDLFSIKNGTVCNKGLRDFIDYRPSVKLNPQLLENIDCKTISLDSLHFDQLQEVSDLFPGSSIQVKKGDQVVNLLLASSYEEYVTGLPRKKRHELKRKKKRFESEHPNAQLKESTDLDIFDAFVSLHKTSDGDKGTFMSEEVENFFKNLLDVKGWKIYYLEIDSVIIACCFVFEDGKGCYLYNSSKNNDYNDVNPGIIIIDKIIEKLINEKYEFFDFLKGTERYKFDLGGTATQLYDLEITI